MSEPKVFLPQKFFMVILKTTVGWSTTCAYDAIFLNQVRASHRAARAWFLEITCRCMHVCVSAPGYYKLFT